MIWCVFVLCAFALHTLIECFYFSVWMQVSSKGLMCLPINKNTATDPWVVSWETTVVSVHVLLLTHTYALKTT